MLKCVVYNTSTLKIDFILIFEGCVVVIDGQKYWYRLVSVSFIDTLAFDTKYRYRYRWISNIDTSIGIAEAQTSILVSVSVSLKKYGIAHLCTSYMGQFHHW